MEQDFIQILVNEAKNGSQEAFNKLVEIMTPRLIAVLYRHKVKTQDIDDLVQETFFSCWKTLHLYDKTRSNFATWVCLIGKHKLIDQYRKDKMRIKKTSHDTQEFDIEIETESKDFLETDIVNSIVSQFGTFDKNFYNLFYKHDLHLEEISDIYNIPLGTVKSRSHRFRETFKKKYLQKTLVSV